MLFSKKVNLLQKSKSLTYFISLYKIKSIFILSSLKKNELWSWPILAITIKSNMYNSFF
jgi:hypothetical protein